MLLGVGIACFILVPTLRVGMPSPTLRVVFGFPKDRGVSESIRRPRPVEVRRPTPVESGRIPDWRGWFPEDDAERRGRHSHAERGNECIYVHHWKPDGVRPVRKPL